MALPNIFTSQIADQLKDRISQLSPTTTPKWGKMNVGQMLAHCNVTYEITYDNIHARPNAFMRFIAKNFIKKIVTNETPYKRNSRTAPVFIVTNEKDFSKEKNRLITYIDKTTQLGEKFFDEKENMTFGKMTSKEWNNMFYKHLNHHLEQFGV